MSVPPVRPVPRCTDHLPDQVRLVLPVPGPSPAQTLGLGHRVVVLAVVMVMALTLAGRQPIDVSAVVLAAGAAAAQITRWLGGSDTGPRLPGR